MYITTILAPIIGGYDNVDYIPCLLCAACVLRIENTGHSRRLSKSLRSNNMRKRLVKYWTQPDNNIDYAVVPIIWLHDFLLWLQSDKQVTIGDIQDTNEPVSIPRQWPCYGTCCDYVRSVNLLADNRNGDL